MHTRLLPLLMAALWVTVAAGPQSASARVPTRLIVTPGQGHAGDTIFLSGSGFAAGRPVSILLRCGTAAQVRVAAIMPGRDGRFVAHPLRLPLRKRAGRCAFSAASQIAATSQTRPVRYTFVRAGVPLARCATQMCLHVQALLVRLKNSAKGNIVISGWPGATADVTVARTQAGAKYKRIHLNWQGMGSMSTTIAPGLLKGLQARVFVRAQLGQISGHAVTSFHVMFGNR